MAAVAKNPTPVPPSVRSAPYTSFAALDLPPKSAILACFPSRRVLGRFWSEQHGGNIARIAEQAFADIFKVFAVTSLLRALPSVRRAALRGRDTGGVAERGENLVLCGHDPLLQLVVPSAAFHLVVDRVTIRAEGVDLGIEASPTVNDTSEAIQDRTRTQPAMQERLARERPVTARSRPCCRDPRGESCKRL